MTERMSYDEKLLQIVQTKGNCTGWDCEACPIAINVDGSRACRIHVTKQDIHLSQAERRYREAVQLYISKHGVEKLKYMLLENL